MTKRVSIAIIFLAAALFLTDVSARNAQFSKAAKDVAVYLVKKLGKKVAKEMLKEGLERLQQRQTKLSPQTERIVGDTIKKMLAESKLLGEMRQSCGEIRSIIDNQRPNAVHLALYDLGFLEKSKQTDAIRSLSDNLLKVSLLKAELDTLKKQIPGLGTIGGGIDFSRMSVELTRNHLYTIMSIENPDASEEELIEAGLIYLHIENQKALLECAGFK